MSALDDLDPATASLIAQLVLADIEEIRNAAGSPDSDAGDEFDSNYALLAYQEELQATLRSFQDLELARSLDNALELDQPILTVLSAVEDGVRDDHEYAHALENGLPLPPQSENQRLLEDADFARLAEDNDSESTGAGDEAEEEYSDGETQTAIVRPARASCVICRDHLRPSVSFRGPCEHLYCRGCLENLARACLRDESLFPLQCCRQPLPMDDVYVLLPIHLRISLRGKIREYSTLARDRLYCARPACSTFLGSTTERTGDITCPRCAAAMCTRCKQTAHPGSACGENVALEQVRALAAERHWQTCPGCGQIIDLHHGCYHMTCRCRTEFCYLCAERWKNCPCPQWEEARLVDTAEQRVENEMGACARVVAPEIFQQRVEQRINRLRYDHDCADGHRWRRRDGRARCEECHFTLPEYLLYCRNCGIGVCVRCARNRL
ncbi:hypothetical protein FB45DRAFT_1065239 [Roridomyces roridus]|uniref:RBR-type E3 ubiquitin transferase n=1 Tax=Roridomyces roridus TaxID=1738132 RepID=A0AAD7FD74_9AGAR|nr:hypothetical protein FB45DRAFT_1065239 [Roridomyces roridus]